VLTLRIADVDGSAADPDFSLGIAMVLVGFGVVGFTTSCHEGLAATFMRDRIVTGGLGVVVHKPKFSRVESRKDCKEHGNESGVLVYLL
jgi:hypothetical protein